jgi:hypothetical protein
LDTIIIREKVNEVVEMLSSFRGLDPRVEEGINDFKYIGECISDPSEERIQRSKILVSELKEGIRPYRNFVPEVNSTLELVESWLNAF